MAIADEATLGRLDPRGARAFCLMLLDALPPLEADLRGRLGLGNMGLIDAAVQALRVAAAGDEARLIELATSLEPVIAMAQRTAEEVKRAEYVRGDNYGFSGEADTHSEIYTYAVAYLSTVRDALALRAWPCAQHFHGARKVHAIYGCHGDPKGAVRIAVEEAEGAAGRTISAALAAVPAEWLSPRAFAAPHAVASPPRPPAPASPAHGSPPFDAYKGGEPYIFISYSHRDGATVFADILALHEAGYRIWYDEGIDPGNEWPEEIAKALDGCGQFVVYVSPRAVDSKNVRNEINFAINRAKPFLAIHLEETSLPRGLELRMGDIQAIMRWRMPAAQYDRKLRSALPRTLCGASADAARLDLRIRDLSHAVVERRESGEGSSAKDASPPPTKRSWSISGPDDHKNYEAICTRCGHVEEFCPMQGDRLPERCPGCEGRAGAVAAAAEDEEPGALESEAERLIARGDSAGARKSLESALALRERRLGSAPDARGLVAGTCVKLGDLLRETDQRAAAGVYDRARLLCDEAIGRGGPDRRELELLLGTIIDRRADLWRRAGDDARAREGYEAALALRRRLAASASPSPEVERGLWVSAIKLGDLLVRAGEHRKALEVFESELPGVEALLAREPSGTQHRKDVSMTLGKVGDQRLRLGEAALAKVAFARAVALREAQCRDQPVNQVLAKDLAFMLRRLADAEAALGNAAEASALRARAGRAPE